MPRFVWFDADDAQRGGSYDSVDAALVALANDIDFRVDFKRELPFRLMRGGFQVLSITIPE